MMTTNPFAYAWRWTHFVTRRLILNRPVVWVDVATGDEEVEHWSRREQLKVLRPRFNGWLKRLDCGCSRRLGRFVYYAMECPQHGFPDLLNDTEETP